MMSETEIKENLRKIAIDEITANLTIGREDDDLIPFTNEEVLQFVTKNSKRIDKCINYIYNDYSNDNELENLLNPMNSQVREYLFDFISFPL